MNDPTKNENLKTGNQLEKQYQMKKEHAEYRPAELEMEFPSDAFPETLREIGCHIADVYNLGSPCLPLMALLGTFSGAVGRSAKLINGVQNYETYPNLMIGIAANPGYGKGSTRVIIKPIQDYSAELAQEWEENEKPKLESKLDSIESQIDGVRSKIKKLVTSGGSQNSDNERERQEKELARLSIERSKIEKNLKRRPVLWVEVSTTAGLVALLRDQSATILSFSQEAGELLRTVLGKYTGNNAAELDLLLKGYSVELYRDTKATRGDTVLHSCISAVWCFQPFIHDQLLACEEALERGFTARVLSVSLEDEPIPIDDGTTPEINPLMIDKWTKLVRRSLDFRLANEEEQKAVRCTPEARERLREFHNEMTKLAGGVYADAANDLTRCRENGCKIALCFALSENPEADEVTETHAKNAIRLVRWTTLNSMDNRRAAFLRIQEERRDTLRKLLSETQNRMLLVSTLVRNHTFKKPELQVLCSTFPKEFEWEKRKSKSPGGGRPSHWIKLLE